VGLFGPPNVEELKDKKNIRGLISALQYRNAYYVRRRVGESAGRGTTLIALPSRTVTRMCAMATALKASIPSLSPNSPKCGQRNLL